VDAAVYAAGSFGILFGAGLAIRSATKFAASAI
jgi:uncharacterized membrane protein